MSQARRFLVILTALTLLVLFAAPAWADDAAQGQKLVERFFRLAQANDVTALAKFMAPGFQSAHDFGSSDKAHELAMLKNIKLAAYELSDFKTTRTGGTLIVTYKVKAAKEVLEGQTLAARAAVRMSVFTKTAEGWLMTGHANLALPAK